MLKCTSVLLADIGKIHFYGGGLGLYLRCLLRSLVVSPAVFRRTRYDRGVRMRVYVVPIVVVPSALPKVHWP